MNIIYLRSSPEINKLTFSQLPAKYKIECWKPSLFSVSPKGLPIFLCLVWWLFHFLHIFHNRDYQIILVRDGKKIVHHSFLLPSHYRFPFMLSDDLQVSQVWTSPDERSNGLASFALEEILLTLFPERRFWYITTETNLASQRLAIKNGFQFHSYGRKVLSFLGPFISRYQSITVSE